MILVNCMYNSFDKRASTAPLYLSHSMIYNFITSMNFRKAIFYLSSCMHVQGGADLGVPVRIESISHGRTGLKFIIILFIYYYT